MPEFLDLHSRTTKVLRALADEAMRANGLHYGQHHLLAALWRQDGRTPGEVAAKLHVTTPTVVKMADRMTTSGLLVRRRDDRDNRLVRLWLTDAGRALQEPVETARRDLEQQVTADLTEAELACLMDALAKVARTAEGLLGSGS
ncbi:MarR family winged helix-turn-helix transcriptional regulator [Actinacidiphila paucisporea]|uniref:DNA-binding transcriptional regulator, MarR family n=1 Tax=Actinacidiphila paucisporea TaxID=310782 RepID=A0A1M7N9R6_9ACTN|nr:MarR family winged helix-turn-helix transcriptional regulator [Actinacidiphila paucisporea]SHN00321.1 DNA-binding transcriptional regulator, MarR family [Actinacidiphila paucisporea]